MSRLGHALLFSGLVVSGSSICSHGPTVDAGTRPNELPVASSDEPEEGEDSPDTVEPPDDEPEPDLPDEEEPAPETPLDAGRLPDVPDAPVPVEDPSGPWYAVNAGKDVLDVEADEYYRQYVQPRVVCTKIVVSNDNGRTARGWEVRTAHLEGSVYGAYEVQPPVEEDHVWIFRPLPDHWNTRISPHASVDFSYCADW